MDVPAIHQPEGCYGKMAEKSAGKDTILLCRFRGDRRRLLRD